MTVERKLLTETEQILTYEICTLRLGTFLWFVLARALSLPISNSNLCLPDRITFGARNVEFYSQLILTNPYEVRLATSGIRNFRKENPNEMGFFLSISKIGL